MFFRPGLRVGRPGLLGTVARTAVIAGTATAVSGSMSRHQQARADEAQQAEAYREQQQAQTYAAQQAAYAPPPAAPAPVDSAPLSSEELIAQLQQLGQLRQSGVLTEAEFAAQKAKLLNS